MKKAGKIISAFLSLSLALGAVSFSSPVAYAASETEIELGEPIEVTDSDIISSTERENIKEATATAITLSLPTKSEIAKKYYELGMDKSFINNYSSNFSAQYPFSAGTLTDATLNQALNTVNFIRYVAGLNPVTLSAQYNKYAQAVSLLCAANRSLNQNQTQPAGMTNEMYNLASVGMRSSNLIMGYTNISDSIIRGYMNDTNMVSINRVAHRRWFINPTMKKIGFGLVGNYSATYVVDSFSQNAITSSYIAWPPANMPYELYAASSSGYAFSVNLGNMYSLPDVNSLTVTVSSKLQNKTWNLDKNCNTITKYLNVDNGNYGQNKCIIFNVGAFAKNDTVTVLINGIYANGVLSPIKYTVNFFSVADVEISLAAPTKLVATAGNKTAKLTWNAVSGASKYRVQRKTASGTWTTIANPTTNSYADSTVTNGTAYSYRVFACTGSTFSAASNTVTVTPSGSVSAPVISAKAGNKTVKLTWNAVANAVKYRVQRKTTSGAWSTIAYPTTNSYTDSAVTNGMTYSYRVLTYSGTTYSAASNTVTVTPSGSVSAPVISATAGNKTVKLTWNAVANAAKYRVQRKTASGAWSTIAYPTTNSYTDSAVTNGTKYSYRVLTYSGTAYSEASNTVTVIPNVTYTTLSLSASFNNSTASLSWNAVTNATKYRIQRSVDGNAWTSVLYTTNISYNDIMSGGTTFSYRVLAYVNSAWATMSNTVTSTAPTGANPPVISGEIGNGSVSLSWSSVEDATKYMLQRKDGTGELSTIATTSAFVTEFFDSNVLNGTLYTYSVFAYVNGVWSTASNSFNAVPSAAITTPTIKLFISGSTATLTWQAVTGATKYRVQRKTGDGAWSSISYPTGLSYFDSSLSTGTSSYRVLAYVGGRWYATSNEISITI